MLQRAFILVLSAYLALAPTQVFASQNALYSPTTGTVSGLQLTNNFNNAIDSVNTCNSGPSAPTNQLSGTPSVGNCWINTTSIPYPVSIYDGADWDVIAHIDATNHWATIPVGGGTASEASASITDLCASANKSAHYLTITGTTTITSFGATCQAGFVKLVTFSGALTLTYNATSLILPGAANVITTAGDQAIVVALGSGNFQVVAYTPASGQALINSAIDVGAIEWTFSPNVPSSKYLWAYGEAVSRSTYSVLEAALTITQSVTATFGSPTLTGFSDTTQIPTGAKAEAAFLPAGATIVSCTSSTCTLSANAMASSTGNVTLFPYGDGDGSTTFNLPHCQGRVMVARNNMSGSADSALSSTYYGANPNALGAEGGAQEQTLATGNLPNFTSTNGGITLSNGGLDADSSSPNNACNLGLGDHCGENGGTEFVITTNGTGDNTPNSNVTITNQGWSAFVGSDSPFPTIQPSITANCMIRVLARLTPLDLSSLPSLAANDNEFAIIERRRAA